MSTAGLLASQTEGWALMDLTWVSPSLYRTALLAVFLLVVGHIANKALTRSQSMEVQRFWRVLIRNVIAIGFLVGSVAIWHNQIQSLLVALGAAVAGVFLVFREPMLSVFAFWIRIVRRQFGLGDFIELGNVRGEVIDITWQHTLLAETGANGSMSYTGRTVLIPNNRMLVEPLFVDNLTGKYSAHVFEIPLPESANIIQAEKLLAEIAERHCAPYTQEAESHMAQLRREKGLDTPSVEPKLRIHFSEKAQAILSLRIVAPARERLRVEQAIVKEFLMTAGKEVWPKARTSR